MCEFKEDQSGCTWPQSGRVKESWRYEVGEMNRREEAGSGIEYLATSLQTLRRELRRPWTRRSCSVSSVYEKHKEIQGCSKESSSESLNGLWFPLPWFYFSTLLAMDTALSTKRSLFRVTSRVGGQGVLRETSWRQPRLHQHTSRD